MEGAAGEVVGPALFQGNVALDHVDYVDAMEQFLLEGIGNHVRIAIRRVAPASASCTIGGLSPSFLAMSSL
jgi:hypothetical protein